MSVLNVENVSHGFGDRIILEDVSFRLLKGEHVGLIGANGEGKSSFLNIITGQLMPDAGKVEWSSRVTVGYLDQHAKLTPGKTIRDILREAFARLFELEREMQQAYEKMATADEEEMNKLLEAVGDIQDILDHSGFYTIDANVEAVANGLGLGSIGLDREVQDLSGGQRTKVLLAKLLLEQPSILLLDEPTNFLDEEHIAWLTKYLQDYENAFILITHDIDFLNKVINLIYHVEQGRLTRYVGDYSKFMELYETNKARHQQAYEKQQKEIDRLEDFVARNKARISTTGRAKSRQKQLEKMELIDKPREKVKPIFKFKEARVSGKIIFKASGLQIGYNRALTRPLDIQLERGQKVALKGCNGLGKSTLLKTLLGLLPPVGGTLETGDYLHAGYFEQEAQQRNSKTALQEVWDEYPGLTQFEVRAALARCGLRNEHITSQMQVLSGGEQAKVRLCKLMLMETNWLALDEPTNHLDVDAKAELKKAIKEFRGTVILVCHEPEFYADVVNEVWNVEDWSNLG